MTVALAAPAQLDSFTERLAELATESGLEYVLLHGRGASQSVDVDIAVAPSSLAALDAIVRSGALGRVVQVRRYDVPSSRLYVLQTGGGERRYRWLDVACDPYGIGRYGRAVERALDRRVAVDGVSVPDAAAQTVYLAAKRARKGLARTQDEGRLRASFESDPDGASALLAETYGPAGRALADVLLAGGGGLDDALDGVERAIARARRRPLALLRRGWFGAARVIERTRRQTGLVLCHAGPDGAGKTTLTYSLLALQGGPFISAVRIGQRRGFFRPPGRLLGRPAGDVSSPHTRDPSGRIGSLARLVYLWLDAATGWLPRVALPRVRTTLVVMERGWDDLAIDPRRYRLSTPRAVARALGALLPRPQLTLILDAPAELIHARKPELALAEIDRQLDDWRRLAAAEPSRYVRIDASGSPEDTLERALEAIDAHLAARHRSFTDAAHALSALGRIAPHGAPHTVISRRKGARYVAPVGGRGPSGYGLYRPAGLRDSLAARALELGNRAGIARPGSVVPLDTGAGLGPVIGRILGERRVELAALAPRGSRGRRTMLAVRAGGRLAAFAKVLPPGGAEFERRVLEALEGAEPKEFRAPRVLAVLNLEDRDVLVLEPLAGSGRTSRADGPVEGAALAELASLGEALRPQLGSAPGLVPVHGDFTGWNCGRGPDGRLALWDWEEARLGLPLEDLFTWRAQRLLRFGRGTADRLVRSALEPDAVTRALADQAGVAAADAAPLALEAALDREGDSDAANEIRELLAAPRRLHRPRFTRVDKAVREPNALQRYVSRRAFRPLERLGFHLVGDHFYEPIPNTRELARRYSAAPREHLGIDFRLEESERELLELLDAYGHEFRAEAALHGYAERNHFFRGLDALALYCLLRRRRPEAVVEIGAGVSTIVIAAALSRNAAETGRRSALTTIDPYQRAPLAAAPRGVDYRALRSQLQELPESVFTGLAEGDLLSVDSSHVFKHGSDVQYQFERIYPALGPGVAVHVHDIFSPFDYPLEWYVRERRFWNEQLFLETMLRWSPDFRVLLPLHALGRGSELVAQSSARVSPSFQPAAKASSFVFERIGAHR